MKNERLALVLTRGEKDALEQMALYDGGLSTAAMVRRLIHEEARRRGIWPKPPFEIEKEK